MIGDPECNGWRRPQGFSDDSVSHAVAEGVTDRRTGAVRERDNLLAANVSAGSMLSKKPTTLGERAIFYSKPTVS